MTTEANPSNSRVDAIDRRRHPRTAARFPVDVLLAKRRGRKRIRSQSVDVSDGGLLLTLPGRLKERSVEVEFRLPPGLFPGSYVHRCRIPARIVRSLPVVPSDWTGPHRAALRLEGTIERMLRKTWRRLRFLGWCLLVAILGNIVFLKIQNVDYFWYMVIWNVYSLGVTLYIVSRFAIAAFYRPPEDVGHRPAVSAIVACKNEEAAIGETLERIYASEYPRDLLEVIAVDDGSTDGTHAQMLRVKVRHPDLRIIRFPKNLGKRHGMAAGARAAKGEILVYIDSDSFLEKDALHYLVQGFADPGVAAVAAHGLVANAWKNSLTKMQAVRYYVAFKVLKSAESVFSSVTCCSGCCAAYRRSAVLEVLDVWLHQTFLGRPATFGDDRSLTNHMLRKHKVIYEDRARVRTLVPENYRQFFRQQLRWKKSWIRESMIAASFMWKKAPLMAFSFYAGVLFPLIAPFVILRALVFLPLAKGEPSLVYAWGVILMSLLYSTYYLISERNRLWLYGVLFCFLYMFVLTWQLPFAIATSWNNKWGTR